MSRKSLTEITHNACIKKYPDGSSEITVSAHRLFRERGWEDERKRHPQARGETSPEESAARSLRRARSRLRDLARSNRFAYFVTLTLDASRVTDRYDISACVRDMKHWLDNRCRRHGLIYILVPEHHKDGAIHFHGFINDALEVVDSGTLSKGGKPRRPRSIKQREALIADGWHVVYNVPSWGFGFSTAIPLYGDYDAAVAYCCKYIGKQFDADGIPQKVGGRWYYSGGKLLSPDITTGDLDFAQLLAQYPEKAWSTTGGTPDMLRIRIQRSEIDVFNPTPSPTEILKSFGIYTGNSSVDELNFGAKSWENLCFGLSLAEDLDDAAEVMDLMRACRNASAAPEEWWNSMVQALRPIEMERPEMLQMMGLPVIPNPLTLAVSVAKNMKASVHARAGYP